MERGWRDGRLRSRLFETNTPRCKVPTGGVLRENHNRLWLHGVWLLVGDSMAGMGPVFALWAGGIGIIRDTPQVSEGVSELFDLMSKMRGRHTPTTTHRIWSQDVDTLV
jgi:hypothetical protein